MSERGTEETAMGRTRRAGRPGRRRLRGLLPAGMFAVLVTGAAAAAASAADYCVAPNTTCGGTPVASFEQALSLAAAAPDTDRIFLSATTYTAPTASGYAYNAPSAPVEIVGVGEGQTVLTGQTGGGTVLRLTGGAGSSVHDLTIRLPQNVGSGFSGLWTGNTAQRLEVVEDPVQASSRAGVVLEAGGRLLDSMVTIGHAQDTSGVLLDAPGVTLSGSSVIAKDAVRSHGGSIERSRLTGSAAAVDATADATTITASLLRVTGGGGVGIDVIGQLGTTATVHADGTTIVGPGAPGTYGAIADDFVFPSASTGVTLTNSIIRGVSIPLSAAAPGTGQATVTASYSDYDPSGNATTGANASIVQTNDSNVGDARFVDAPGGDFHLRPDSPLIDTGDPATSQALDLDGNALVVDGNGDGIARRDKGAFELQPAAQPAPSPGGGEQGGALVVVTRPPSISGFRADPAVFAVTPAGTSRARRAPHGTYFRFTLSEDSRVTITIRRILPGRRHVRTCVRRSRQLRHAARCIRYRTVGTLSAVGTHGPNSLAFAGRIRGRALLAGTYLASIRATDAAGKRSIAPIARFRIVTS